MKGLISRVDGRYERVPCSLANRANSVRSSGPREGGLEWMEGLLNTVGGGMELVKGSLNVVD